MARSRITREQADQILTAYATQGPKVAYAIAAVHGLSSNGVRKLAMKAGVRAKLPPGQEWRGIRNSEEDRRWERAKAIGPVLA